MSKIPGRAYQRPILSLTNICGLGQVYNIKFDRRVLKFLKLSKFESSKSLTVTNFVLGKLGEWHCKLFSRFYTS